MPAFLSARRLQSELMDDPQLDEQAHHKALIGLDRLQRVSRTAAQIWNEVRRVVPNEDRPIRWLDLACGSGRVLLDVVAAAERDQVIVEPTGCDLSPTALHYAAQLAASRNVAATWVNGDATSLPFDDNTFDVVSCSLFLHHLEDAAAVTVLQEMARCGRVVVMNDLRRTTLGWLMAHVAGQALTRSPIVHVDGPRSVEGAYSNLEMKSLLSRAGFDGTRLRRCWPQRMVFCGQPS